jgi:hypothetical protein
MSRQASKRVKPLSIAEKKAFLRKAVAAGKVSQKVADLVQFKRPPAHILKKAAERFQGVREALGRNERAVA